VSIFVSAFYGNPTWTSSSARRACCVISSCAGSGRCVSAGARHYSCAPSNGPTRYQITSLETLERIALLQLDDTALPDPLVDPELEKRPAYQEGSLSGTPDLSRYDE